MPDLDGQIEAAQQREKRKIQRRDAIRGLFSLDVAILDALDDLTFRRQTIFDIKPVEITDDLAFDEANPNHCKAMSNRFVRMDAADFLFDVARYVKGHSGDEDVRRYFAALPASSNLFNEHVLKALHDALFDRDAAVRMTILETLALLARPESVPHLENLAISEDEGFMIPTAIQKVLEACKTGRSMMIRDVL